MKKKLLFAALLVAAQATHVLAQKNGGSDYDPMAKPNIVKINLTSLAYKNIALQYERILGDKISVACGVRFMPKGSLAFTNTIDNLANSGSSSDSVKLSDWKAGSLAITPEFRFYPKHAGKGFYLAPYLRYRTISLDLPVNYTDGNGAQQSLSANGNITSFMGGLMIGSQFNLGKMVTLDWFILGLQYGSSNIKLDIKTTQTMSAADQNDVRDNLEEIKDLSKKFDDINYSVNANGGNIDGKLSSIGIRGFGLNLGFKF